MKIEQEPQRLGGKGFCKECSRSFMVKNSTSIPHKEKTRQVKYAKDQIDILSSKIEDESIKYGAPRNGTLARYNRNLSLLNIYSGDLGLAEKYSVISFGHLKDSYSEALTLQDTQLRQTVMANIAQDHLKLIRLFAKIKLSYSSGASKDLINELHASLRALIVPQLMKNTSEIWTIVFNELNDKMRSENVDFIDNDGIVSLIDKELIPKLTISSTDFRDLQWLSVRVYQAIVKRDRRKSYNEASTAKQLAKYRYESASRLHDIGERERAVEDLSESRLFELLACENIPSWKLKLQECISDFEKVIKEIPNEQRFIHALYAKVYTKGFNLSSNTKDRYEYISLAVKHAQHLSEASAQRLLPHLYITEILIWLRELNSQEEVAKKIRTNHHALPLEAFADDVSYTVAHDLYICIASLIFGGTYASRGVSVVDSIDTLLSEGVINRSDRLFIDLAIRALSVKTAVSLEELTTEHISTEASHVNIESIKKMEYYLLNEEGYDIEVKLSGDSLVSKIAESICALANTSGGRVIIGLIEKEYFAKRFPDKEIANFRIIGRKFVFIGQSNYDPFRQKLAAYIKLHGQLRGLDLSDIYIPSLLSIDNKDSVILEVNPVFKKRRILLSINDRAYGRYDNQTTEMKTTDVIEKMSADTTSKTN